MTYEIPIEKEVDDTISETEVPHTTNEKEIEMK